jgi:autotransporter-associated beta strand protein
VTFAGGTLRLAIAGPATVSNALIAAPADSIGLDIGAGNYQLGQLTLGAAFNVVGAGSVSFAGPIAMAAAGPTTINSTANVTFVGPVTGGAGLILTPGGTLTFSGAGANTYGGATQVIGSTLVLNKPSGTVAVPGDLAVIGASTVQLNASGQIGAGSNVSFNSAGGLPVLNINGQSQTIATISSIQSGAGTIQLGAGTLTVAGNGVANTFSGSLQGTGRLVKSGTGTLTLGGPNTFGGLTVSGGVLKLAADQHLSSLISTGGQLDVQASQLFVTYPILGFSPAATIRAELHSGAITSSLDTANARVGLADWADGADPGLPFHTILLKRTRVGDLNLDGIVNFSDLLLLAQHYGQTNRNWDQGDLNYDGSVNFSDLLALAQNYGQSTPALAAPALAQVPEPALLGWFVVVPLAALSRRRLRRR